MYGTNGMDSHTLYASPKHYNQVPPPTNHSYAHLLKANKQRQQTENAGLREQEENALFVKSLIEQLEKSNKEVIEQSNRAVLEQVKSLWYKQ